MLNIIVTRITRLTAILTVVDGGVVPELKNEISNAPT